MSSVTTETKIIHLNGHYRKKIANGDVQDQIEDIMDTQISEKKLVENGETFGLSETGNNDDEIEMNNNNDDSKIISKMQDALKKPYKIEILWTYAIGYLILHLAGVYGLYLGLFKSKLMSLAWMVLMTYASALATTMGAHRLYAHKTFKANKWVRFILVVGQTLAGQQCMWVWVRNHRQHHKYSETHGDPHNATRGFFFSHVGWLIVRKHPEIFIKGRTIDMSDINADPFVMFQKKHYMKLFWLISIGFPVAIPLLWGETFWNSLFLCFATRYIFSLNITFLVNSAAHLYGTKPFSKDIYPAENWFVSLFAMGEGWHNYHHTFPWDYKAAEYGQYFNVTTSVIDYCAKKGWVYDIKCASEELVKRHSLKRGDGSHKIYGKMKYVDENLDRAY